MNMIIIPYAFFIIAVLLWKPLTGHSTSPYFGVIIPICLISIVICFIDIVRFNSSVLNGGNSSDAASQNLKIKGALIPLYMAYYGFAVYCMQPEMAGVIFIPIAAAVGLRFLTGARNIGGCILLHRENKSSGIGAALLCVCGFIAFLDLIAALIQNRSSQKQRL